MLRWFAIVALISLASCGGGGAPGDAPDVSTTPEDAPDVGTTPEPMIAPVPADDPEAALRQQLAALLEELEERYPDLYDDPPPPSEIAELKNGWKDLEALFAEAKDLWLNTPGVVAGRAGMLWRYSTTDRPDHLNVRLSDEDRRDLFRWLASIAELIESAQALLHYDCFVPDYPESLESQVFAVSAFYFVDLLTTASYAALILEDYSEAESTATLSMALASRIQGEAVVAGVMPVWTMRQRAAAAILDVTGDFGRSSSEVVEAALAHPQIRLPHHVIWRGELTYAARAVRELLERADDSSGPDHATAEEVLKELEEVKVGLRILDAHLQHRPSAPLNHVETAITHFAAFDAYIEANNLRLDDVYRSFATVTYNADIQQEQALIALRLRRLDLLRKEDADYKYETELKKLKAEALQSGFNVVEKLNGYVVTLVSEHPMDSRWTEPLFVERVSPH
jgi:hypothetical protein